MNRRKSILVVLISILCLIIFHNNIITLISNISSIFRKDNRLDLVTNTYKLRVDNLSREISEYESNSNLDISKDRSLILAKVSLRNIYDIYDYLVISTSSMVGDNKAVLNEKGLVGITDASSKENAKVRLLTGKNKVSVKINNTYGLLGNYDKKTKLFKMNNLSNYEKIKKGDVVTTSGLNEIPGNIYVGRVVKTKKEGFKEIVYVKSDVDFNDLNYLYVAN